MDVLTKPQNWVAVQQRPTEDLIRVWENRDLEIWSDELLQDVRQVLITRKVIKTRKTPRITSWHELLGMPVIDTFEIRQIMKGEKNKTWSVSILEDKAQFYCSKSGEEFTMARVKARNEIIFQRSGIFFQKEGSSALIQGKLFDLTGNKQKLLSWLPELTMREIGQIQKQWGAIYVVAGVLSLLFSSLFTPLVGSILIFLGMLSMLFKGKVLYVINGCSLLFMSALNVYTFLMTFSFSSPNAYINLAFWVSLSLCIAIWGLSEIRKLAKFKAVS